ncbi:MAG: TonB-dependent receptor plug domain-containing protein [Methylococcaceae bacterium]
MCSVIVLLFQDLAFAEDKYSKSNTLSSKEDHFLFQEIPSVYSASKYEQKVSKAPASISIVTADEIKKYGYRTFSGILSSLKGFYSTYDRNYGQAGARGFGLPSDYNTRLLLLIDGHRFNDNIYDSFDTSEGFPVDIDVIERVEVVRGPSSSLYGTNAFFGVINVITKRGRDQKGASVKASYGSNDTYKTSASYGDRFSNGLETFLSGTFYNSQGFNKLFYQEFNDPATNNGVSVNNDGEQAGKLMAKASYEDFALEGLYVNRQKDVPTAAFDTLFNNDPTLNTLDQATFGELKYDHTFANQLNLQSRLSYNNYRLNGELPYPGLINKDLAYGEWWRAELEATKTLLMNHRLTAGGQFQDNFHQFQSNYDETQRHEADVSTYQWALFIQDEYSITETLTLNAGVRFDYFSIFGGTTNPRIGLIYSPWENSAIKLLYGTAFRAPNQFELNYSGSGLLTNIYLNPEKLDTKELIFEYYFTRQLRGELNIFETEIDDLITSTATPKGLQNQNTGNVDSHGVEVQLEDSWSNGFQGRLSYSWQETRDQTTNERLVNSPEHMVKLNLIAPLWSDKVFIGFETQYMSSRITPSKLDSNGQLIPRGLVSDYVLNNLTLFSQNWIKGLELSSGVYNLFDQPYFDPGSTEHRQNGIEQNSVTFRIKASLDF